MKMEAETTESTSAAAFNACGVCKESFKSREPKLLPCLHTFCRSCVLSEAGDGRSSLNQFLNDTHILHIHRDNNMFHV